jgi:hypothetical protein
MSLLTFIREMASISTGFLDKHRKSPVHVSPHLFGAAVHCLKAAVTIRSSFFLFWQECFLSGWRKSYKTSCEENRRCPSLLRVPVYFSL